MKLSIKESSFFMKLFELLVLRSAAVSPDAFISWFFVFSYSYFYFL